MRRSLWWMAWPASKWLRSGCGTIARNIRPPRLIVASRMDRDRADADRVLESLTNAFGRAVIPLELPIGKEKNFRGVVDLVTMKAYTYELGGNGKGKEVEIPADMKDEAQAQHEKLVELVAEGNDALLEEFFEKGTIPEEDLIPALHNAIREDKIFPVIFGSGLGNIGADRVMDFIVDYTPAPSEHEWVQGDPASSSNGEPPRRHETDAEPVSLYVFKTVSDPFAGRISYFKVFSGVLKNDATLLNFSRGSQEKFAHISIMQGKTAVPVTELHAGDIGAVAKLKDTLTGDTLGDKVSADPISASQSAGTGHHVRHRTQEPRRRGQAGPRHPQAHGRRRHAALLPRSPDQGIPDRGHRPAAHRSSRLQNEEAVPHRSGAESSESSVSRDHSRQGRRAGQAQEANRRTRPVRRLQNQDGTAAARWRVRIRQRHFRRRDSQELHSRRRKRNQRRGGARISGRISGGRLPGDLYDGSYHDVDSNDMSFQMAGRIAFKKAMEVAKPTLLEPVMAVEITVPDDFAGRIMGDLNSRRGRIQGMDNKGGNTVVKAEVPMAEMLTYGVDLTSMTQGRGSFNMEMHHYDAVPACCRKRL